MKRIISSSLVMFGLLVIGLLIWAAPTVSADTSGVWNLTGSMTTNRRHSSVYPLPDGRILVIGGTDTTGVDGTAGRKDSDHRRLEWIRSTHFGGDLRPGYRHLQRH